MEQDPEQLYPEQIKEGGKQSGRQKRKNSAEQITQRRPACNFTGRCGNFPPAEKRKGPP
jgi:hypothetical protein